MKWLGLAFSFLVACNSSQQSAGRAMPPPATPATTAPEPSTATAGSDAPGIGQTCGANDACASGLTCVKYYGIAGPRGPEFTSCEIKCKSEADCPGGHRCVTIADGPGQVCRPQS